jgi:cytochrome c oxidase assembly protein subunit 15
MGLHRYATLVAASTLLLIVAGGMVTSTGSGLAVPDWPTSYGYFMFSFPLRFMVGGIFYEHGHRLLASTVGLLTIGLAAWLWLREPRRWVRRLGILALVAVTLQGILGGITVLYLLPAPISVMHAGLAQIFFCLAVSIALFTSPTWLHGYPSTAGEGPGVDDRRLRRLAVGATAVVYAQILLGATMRHTGAGLAIPDFPLAFGGLVPRQWDAGIAIHFAHRIGALAATTAVLAAAGRALRRHANRRELRTPAILVSGLVIVQVVLGAFTIWTAKDPAVNTAHVATGALVLVASLVLALRACRVLFRAAPAVQAAVDVARLGVRSSAGVRA